MLKRSMEQIYYDIDEKTKKEELKMEQEEEIEVETNEEEIQPDIQKIYIKNYGNLSLEMLGTNEIGVSAYSEKRKETLFIPWNSIIMISKVEDESGS